MKSILMLMLMIQTVSLASQSEVEFTEASHSNVNDENLFLDDKVSGSSVSDQLDQTIQLPSHSNISWQLLVNFFNLTKEDLDLSYETISNKGQRTLTLKRARGQRNDKKSLNEDNYQLARLIRNRRATKQEWGASQSVSRAKRVIFGEDERKKLPSSSKAQRSPHSAACKVSCKGFCSWSCSGILIGPQYVLTSAHCIDGEDVGTLQVGFLERNGRFQWYDVDRAYVPLRWKVNKDDDYAVLKLTGLPSRRSSVSIVSTALSQGSTISITGFPGDKSPSSLWISKCRALKVSSGLIWNDCDVTRGSSGSGVLVKDSSNGSTRTVVVGVLSGERTLKIRGRSRKLRLNVAVYLTGPRVTQINQWTSE